MKDLGFNQFFIPNVSSFLSPLSLLYSLLSFLSLPWLVNVLGGFVVVLRWFVGLIWWVRSWGTVVPGRWLLWVAYVVPGCWDSWVFVGYRIRGFMLAVIWVWILWWLDSWVRTCLMVSPSVWQSVVGDCASMVLIGS